MRRRNSSAVGPVQPSSSPSASARRTLAAYVGPVSRQAGASRPAHPCTASGTYRHNPATGPRAALPALHNARMTDGNKDTPSAADGNGGNGGSGGRSGSGYTNSIVMGLVFSVVFGLLVFDNIALGFGVGLPIGIAIGMAADSKRKSNGDSANGDSPKGG